MFNKKYFIILTLMFTSVNCTWFDDAKKSVSDASKETKKWTKDTGKEIGDKAKKAGERLSQDIDRKKKEYDNKRIYITIINESNKNYKFGFKDPFTSTIDFDIVKKFSKKKIKAPRYFTYPHFEYTKYLKYDSQGKNNESDFNSWNPIFKWQKDANLGVQTKFRILS